MQSLQTKCLELYYVLQNSIKVAFKLFFIVMKLWSSRSCSSWRPCNLFVVHLHWCGYGKYRVEFIQPCVSFISCQICLFSAIRYHVFRWESCKDYVWESVKNSSVCAFKRILVTGSHKWLVTVDSPKCHTCEACRKLKGHDNWSTAGQKRTVWVVSYFVTQTRNSSQSWVSRKNTLFCKKNDFSHSSCTLL